MVLELDRLYWLTRSFELMEGTGRYSWKWVIRELGLVSSTCSLGVLPVKEEESPPKWLELMREEDGLGCNLEEEGAFLRWVGLCLCGGG